MPLASSLVPEQGLAQSRWARGGGEEEGEVRYVACGAAEVQLTSLMEINVTHSPFGF